MRRLGGLAVVLALLAGAQAAQAKQAHAESRELVKSGPASTAKNWSPEGKPGAEDTLEVPAGKTLELTKGLVARNLTVDGTIARTQNPITLTGNLVLHAPVLWEGTLHSEGFDHLVTDGNRIASIEQNEGIIELGEPLHVGIFQWHGSVDTNGYELTVDTRLYRLERSYTNYSTSRVVAGEYLAFNRDDHDTLVTAEHAEIVVRGQARSVFKGAACYGSVILEAGETMWSASSYMVEGRWEDNTPALTVEPGSTISVEGDLVAGEVVFGSAARSVGSSEPGHPYTLALPYALETSTTATISDMHVTGSTLTAPNATDGGGNEGVVF